MKRTASDRPSPLLSAALLALAGICLSHTAAVAASLPVLDLCTLTPDGRAERSVVQRVMLFDVNASGRAEGTEAVFQDGKPAGSLNMLKKAGAAAAFREVFLMSFAMKRFYNVAVPTPAPSKWFQARTLARADVERYVRKRKRGGAFFAYSVGCVDYLALPRLDRFDAKWTLTVKQVKVGKKVVTVRSYEPRFTPSMSLRIFKRTEGNTFELVDEVSAQGGGLFDLATNIGAATLSQAKKGSELLAPKLKGSRGLKSAAALKKKLAAYNRKIAKWRERVETAKGVIELASGATAEPGAAEKALQSLKAAQQELDRWLTKVEALGKLADLDFQGAAHDLAIAQQLGWSALVSGVPAGDCSIPKRGKDGVAGGLDCTADDSALPVRAVGLAGLSERSSPHCKDINRLKGSKKTLPKVALCETRIRAENITLQLQKESRKIDAWRLWAPLQLSEGDPCLALGTDEGVRRGDMFEAVEHVDGGWRRIGFGRVKTLGPGGAGGSKDPSMLRFLAGGADSGTRIQEHPQIGVSLAVGPLVSLMTETAPSMEDAATFPGATVEVGYNMTHLVPIGHEFWMRTYLDGLFLPFDRFFTAKGGSRKTNFVMISAFAGPEVKVHLFSRVDLFVGAAVGYTIAIASEQTDSSGNSDSGGNAAADESKDTPGGSARTAGALGVGGLDLLLSPDWSVRLTGGYRWHATKMVLESSDDDPAYDGTPIGTFNGVNASATLGYIF